MILFNNFKKHYSNNEPDFSRALNRVLHSGWYVLGQEVASFEREFARFLGCRYCVGVASGTDALALCLMACGIGRGDEVITTDLTAYATIAAIMQAGSRPVVVDIREEDGLIDCSKIEEKITAATKAIIAVHLYGQSCDLGRLTVICKQHSIRLIEDCAQSAGATFSDGQTGAFGICNAFSFYPTKNLGAFGDGGAVTTADQYCYEKLLMLRNYGQKERYYHECCGINSRLDEIQAALLRVKLGSLRAGNQRRSSLASLYRSSLTTLQPLVCRSYGRSNHHLFVVKHPQRDAFMRYLQNHGIQTLIHYPVPVHRQKAFPFQKQEHFPAAEAFCQQIFSLPLYPELSDNEVQRIIEVCNDFRKKDG
ncbi:MAG: DegT/DnrJ/EryC1/StrS family aminotransferase [Chitinivibrionales bacterium]|nr:DegT/DnrJ/EryC1/StrS family aminotransferase [Chitinivibrionales bacterium]